MAYSSNEMNQTGLNYQKSETNAIFKTYISDKFKRYLSDKVDET